MGTSTALDRSGLFGPCLFSIGVGSHFENAKAFYLGTLALSAKGKVLIKLALKYIPQAGFFYF
jgi:hypothetical protein